MRRKLSDEIIIKIASAFKTKKEFRNADPSAYALAIKRGIWDKCSKHMKFEKHENNYWTFERCKIEALKYKTKTAFKQGNSAAYGKAYRMGWLKDITSFMNPKVFWTKEACALEAQKYKDKKEFRDSNPGAYSYANKHNFLNEICTHMNVIGNYNKRKIYVFEFEDNYAYVGLSFNPEKRKLAHLKNEKSPVYKHLKETGKKFVHKILSDWLSKEEAAKEENKQILFYAQNGWNMLNSKAGGALGSARQPLYSLEELRKEAQKYKYKTEFRKGSPSHYEFAYRNHLMDEICKHMPHWHRYPTKWTDEAIFEIAKKCNFNKTIIFEKYPGAYEAILKRNLSEMIFGNKPRVIKHWTIDEAKKIAQFYGSTKELHKKNKNCYEIIMRHHWQSECFANFQDYKPCTKGIHNINEILELAKKYESITAFRKEHEKVYRAALSRIDWREQLFSILPHKRKGHSLSECKRIAYKYQSRKAFQKGDSTIYSYASRHGLLDKICSHMTYDASKSHPRNKSVNIEKQQKNK